jgi:hypothetical protein
MSVSINGLTIFQTIEFMVYLLSFDKKSSAPKSRGFECLSPFSAEACSCRAGVLALTAGGTAPEFHRLALHLSSRSPESTLLFCSGHVIANVLPSI